MKNVAARLLRAVPSLLCAALVAAGMYVLPPLEWTYIGEQAAVWAIGLHSPREGVLYMEDRLTTAAVSDSIAPRSPAAPTVYAGTLYEAVKTVIPPKGDGGGAVSERQLGGGTDTVGVVSIKNSSSQSFDFAALCEQDISFEINQAPQVLIVHTHTTECYMSYYAGYYNEDDTTRSTDPTQTVAAVGEAIAEQLRAHGIGVIHDTTLHDHPEYTGAYSRSAKTVEQYLQEYPSISLVLDIHRDAMMQEDMTKIKPTATVDGQKASQMMIVVGAENSSDAPNPHVEHNLSLGLQLHETLETAHEGLMRPLYLVNARYNQHLCKGSLLIEVGTDANVLSESLYSARLLGNALAVSFVS